MTIRIQRRDASEPGIIEALEAVGATVEKLTDKDMPDLLVGYRGATYLIECKNPLGPNGGGSKGGQKLRPGQRAFVERWQGLPVCVARTPAEALNAIGCGADVPDPESFVVGAVKQRECSTPFDCFARGTHVCGL